MQKLFSSRGLAILMNDLVIDYGAVVVELTSTIVSIAFSVLYSRKVIAFNQTVFVVVAAAIAFLTSAVMLKMLTAAMSAVMVCFAENPEALQVYLLSCGEEEWFKLF